jgi:hypothetical protein
MKILAASIPEYFPSINLYLKLLYSDVFLLADNLQYSKHSLVNRTNIKTPEGKKWLTVPVLTSKKGIQTITEVNILPESNWRRKHELALKANYKFSPYFEYYFPKYEKLFNSEWQSILNLDITIIDIIKKQLRINKELHYSSKLKSEKSGTDRISELVKKYNCDAYLIFESEISFVNKKDLEKDGIELIIKKFIIKEYMQQFEPFIPDLSIIDLLFNLGNDSIEYLHSCMN